jgi:indole-3-glycerol phosphate synthase
MAAHGYDPPRVNERSTRRFSQAIAEGEGISVVARVASAEEAESAAAAGADAVLIANDIADLRDTIELPVLSRARGGADAQVVRASSDEDTFETEYRSVVDGGLECVVEVHDEDDLERVLEQVDPEIFLLSCRDDDDEKLDTVLELLPNIPAGKLVVADVGSASVTDVAGLERVGVDAVIVAARDVAAVVGDDRPSG